MFYSELVFTVSPAQDSHEGLHCEWLLYFTQKARKRNTPQKEKKQKYLPIIIGEKQLPKQIRTHPNKVSRLFKKGTQEDFQMRCKHQVRFKLQHFSGLSQSESKAMHKKFCLDDEIPQVILLLFQPYPCFQTGSQLSLASPDRFYLVFFDCPREQVYKIFISITD